LEYNKTIFLADIQLTCLVIPNNQNWKFLNEYIDILLSVVYPWEAKVQRSLWSLISMGTDQSLWNFRLFKTILALTYVLCLLLAVGLQCQKKVLEDGIGSYKKRSKYVTINTKVWCKF